LIYIFEVSFNGGVNQSLPNRSSSCHRFIEYTLQRAEIEYQLSYDHDSDGPYKEQYKVPA